VGGGLYYLYETAFSSPNLRFNVLKGILLFQHTEGSEARRYNSGWLELWGKVLFGRHRALD